jgi:hypothetical protein
MDKYLKYKQKYVKRIIGGADKETPSTGLPYVITMRDLLTQSDINDPMLGLMPPEEGKWLGWLILDPFYHSSFDEAIEKRYNDHAHLVYDSDKKGIYELFTGEKFGSIESRHPPGRVAQKIDDFCEQRVKQAAEERVKQAADTPPLLTT